MPEREQNRSISSIASNATERTRLAVKEQMAALHDGYGLESHAIFAPSPCHTEAGKEYLTDYRPLKLSTFRVFAALQSTVFANALLWLEQLCIIIVFAAFATPAYLSFKVDIFADRKGDISGREWIANQEEQMRKFASIMTFLAVFLLGFYTMLSVGRWWAMRGAGVGGIKAATVELEWLLYQNVTQEADILSAIRRYGRTSMMLIFFWRQYGLIGGDQSERLKSELVDRKLLLEDEADQLVQLSHGAKHEIIWAWQGGIVTTLRNEGKIKSDALFNTLIQRCTEGRAAVQLIHTHLAVRIPMQYVHVLGLLVKMHNLVLAVIMGILFGIAARNQQIIICFQTFARTCLLPFVFNAILLIDATISDPFNGQDTNFPGSVYSVAIEKDCLGFVDATDNLPEWLKSRSDKAKKEAV